MDNGEAIVFLALDLTKKEGSADPLPLRNSFPGDDKLCVHNGIHGMAICFFDPVFKSFVFWDIKIVDNPSPIGPYLSLFEALQDLKEVSENKILAVPNSRELLFLQVALIRWQIELHPKQYLDFLSYEQGMRNAKGLALDIDVVAQEIQQGSDRQARLNYCVETYRALQESQLPSKTEPAKKDGDIWPDSGCYGSSCVGC